MPDGSIVLIAPMKLTTNTWVSSKRTWRAFALALSFALLIWVGFAPGFAQTSKARRVVSMKLADGREGSRVTVLADLNLNDYEAYRRGDRFFLRLPASEFASARPNFRGNGFDDIQIQRTGESVLISFKLQPEATARVDQRFNRLDVVFTASRANNNQNNLGASIPNVGINSAQNRDQRTSDAAGPLPPNTPVNVSRNTTDRTDRSNSVPSGGSNPVGDRDQNIPSGETSPGKAAKTSVSPASTTGNANSGTLLPSIQPVAGSNTRAGTQTPSSSSASPTPYESYLPTSTPATVTSTPYVASNPSVNNERPSDGSVLSQRWSTFKEWLRFNWKLLVGVVAALIILVIGRLFLRRRQQSQVARQLLASGSLRWKGENVGPTYKPAVEQGQSDEPSIAEEIVSIDPAQAPSVEVDEPASPVAITNPTEEKVLELPPSAASVSELSEVKELAVEPPFSNTPAQFERADFELKKLLSGREFDANLIDAPDSPTRQVIAASLMAALAGRNFEQHDHARRAFVDYGYFDETTKDLRTADSPTERAASARKLGLVGDSRATAHLIAALYDSAPEVRRASVEVLEQIGDGSAIKPLNDLLQRETSRQVSEDVIRQAINSITVTEVKRTPVAEKTALRVVEKKPEAPVGHPSNADFVASIDEIKNEDLEAQEFVPTIPSFPAVSSVSTQSFVSAEEETLRQEEEEALRQAELERRRLDIEMARKKFEDDALLKVERETQPRAEIEVRVRAEEEARRRAAEEALRQRMDEEVRIKAEPEARVKAEEEARIRAEEEARFRLEAYTLRRAAEDLARKRAEAASARRFVEEEARRRVEEEARQRTENEARLGIDSDAKRRIDEEIRRKVEFELLTRAEEQARRIAEEAKRQRVEEEARPRAEEAALPRVADEARRMAEEQARRLAEHDMLRRSQAEGLFREAEERRRSEEERHQLEQQALIQAADEVARRRREIEEARRNAEEDTRLLVETQDRIRIEEENRRRAAEERERLEIRVQKARQRRT